MRHLAVVVFAFACTRSSSPVPDPAATALPSAASAAASVVRKPRPLPEGARTMSGPYASPAQACARIVGDHEDITCVEDGAKGPDARILVVDCVGEHRKRYLTAITLREQWWIGEDDEEAFHRQVGGMETMCTLGFAGATIVRGQWSGREGWFFRIDERTHCSPRYRKGRSWSWDSASDIACADTENGPACTRPWSVDREADDALRPIGASIPRDRLP